MVTQFFGPKDPNDLVNAASIDFSPILQPRAATIAGNPTYAIKPAGSLVVGNFQVSENGMMIIFQLSGGQPGVEYDISWTIQDTLGDTWTRSILPPLLVRKL